VGRMAYGVSDRVERLKGLGNAVVPYQVYPITEAIAWILREAE
jgi:DNA (cytosine-5)-methyltransferase 1